LGQISSIKYVKLKTSTVTPYYIYIQHKSIKE